MWNNLKAIGNTTIQLASSAATAASTAAKETYNELNEVPTKISCSKCKNDIAIPTTMFEWYCATPACEEKGVTLKHADKACPTCLIAKPQYGDKTIPCQICQEENIVFSSNAQKHLNSAKVMTISAYNTTKAYADSALKELKSVPTHYPCSACHMELEIPSEVFNWACPACEAFHSHEKASQKACDECKAERTPEQIVPPQVQCPNCEAVSAIPFSNAEKHLNQAVDLTKKTYAAAKTAVAAEYKRLAAKPEQFNCRICEQLLAVTPDENGQLPPEAMCPKCNNATKVPKTVFENSVLDASHQMKFMTVKAYADVAGNPYLTCDVCQNCITLPKAGPAVMGEDGIETRPPMQPADVTCNNCKKVFVAQK